MRLHKFESYDEYKRIQTETNKRKINLVWVEESHIEFISNELKKKLDDISFGLCHGTRRGKEQEWFRKYLGAEVIGTEISDTATQFPHTIEWDFHAIKPEWENSVDFIYSNSLDHSYDPIMCLSQWMKCLREGGYCILHWHKGHRGGGSTRITDPFGARLGEYVDMIMKEDYDLREVVKHTDRFVIWVKK